jgi:hypothetical protein
MLRSGRRTWLMAALALAARGPGSNCRQSNAYAGRGLKLGALSMESRDVADLRCRCFCGRCYRDTKHPPSCRRYRPALGASCRQRPMRKQDQTDEMDAPVEGAPVRYLRPPWSAATRRAPISLASVRIVHPALRQASGQWSPAYHADRAGHRWGPVESEVAVGNTHAVRYLFPDCGSGSDHVDMPTATASEGGLR